MRDFAYWQKQIDGRKEQTQTVSEAVEKHVHVTALLMADVQNMIRSTRSLLNHEQLELDEMKRNATATNK